MTVTPEQIAAGIARLRRRRADVGQAVLVVSDQPYEVLAAVLARPPDEQNLRPPDPG